MEEERRENQVKMEGMNLFDYVDKHCKEDNTYSVKIWDDTYKKRISRYWREPVDMGFEVDMDKATLKEKYYDFEL